MFGLWQRSNPLRLYNASLYWRNVLHRDIRFLRTNHVVPLDMIRRLVARTQETFVESAFAQRLSFVSNV